MEDTKTLFEIENSFEDSNTDRIIPQESDWTPRETVLPLTDAYKTYTQQADLVRAVLMQPKASVVEKVGRGLKRTSDMLLDIPENFVNMMARATNGYTYPNMTEQEANEVLEAGVRSMLATKQARAITEEYEGVADSDITKWVGMAGQVGAYAVIGYLTGGTGIGILGGIQTAGETSQEWAEKYYKDNYGMRGYNAAGDTLWAMTHGAISGFIESKLGVERMAEKAIVKTGAKRALKQAALGAIGEGAEEALQELSAFMLGNVAGSETRTEKEFLHDALTSAMYGSILGGPFGGGLYYVNRSKIAGMFKRQGYSDEDAVKLATTLIDDGKSALIKEIGTVNSLKEKIGSPFDSLVAKIDSALTSAGWTDTDPFVILEDGRIERKSAIEEGTAYTEASRLDYATYVASDIAGQVLRQADKAQVPTSDILNLAEIEVHGNMLSLKPQKLRTSKQIKSKIESVNADLKTARAELRAENAKKTTLQTDPKRVEQLRGIINDLTTKKGILQQLLTSKQSIEKTQDVATERKKQQIGLDTAQSFKDAKTVAKKQSATEFTQSISKKDATVDAKTAQKRYNNAIVAWLCDGDTRLFDQLMTSNGMTVKAIESIVQYGQQIMAFDAAHPELGLRADMQNALSRMLEMKHKGEFKQFVQQDGTFAENALMYNMVFAQHTGDISAFLQSYIQRAESNTQFTKDDLLFQTLKEIYPTQFDGDTAIDKDLVAVFISQNDQQEPAFDAREIIPESELKAIRTEVIKSLTESGIQAENANDISDHGAVYIKIKKGEETRQIRISASKIGKKHKHNIVANFDAKSVSVPEMVAKIKELQAQDKVSNQKTRLKGGKLADVNVGAFEEWKASESGSLFQSAYAGSRIDYDRPSLEAIGTGEGAQAHGWGLYYALDPQIAENYRKTFIADEKRGSNNYFYNGTPVPETKYKDIDGLTLKHLTDTGKNATERWIIARIKDIEDLLSTAKRSEHSEEWFVEGNTDIQAYKKTLSLLEDMNVDLLKYIEPKGQVHEVDIPEMDVLLDEQKTFDEQSEFVKEKLAEVAKYIDSKKNTAQDSLIKGLKEKLGQKGFDEWSKTNQGIFDKSNILKEWSTLTGKQIYDSISKELNRDDNNHSEITYKITRESDKKASLLLEKYGIKGITYWGKQDGRCFVIFNDKDVKVLRKKFDELGNQLFQRSQANGMYDPELNVIVLGRNFNTTTLPHELSHFWLNNTFQLFKQAQKGYPVAQEWLDETQRLFDILGINANQDTLTREQQENWASMNEAIITGLANVPDGATLPITGYLNWIPEKYKSLLNIGYRDKNGKVVYPILDKAAMDFFNVWYGNITLPALPTSPAREQASNPVSESGETVPSTPQVIKERTEQINKAIKDQTDADKALYESAVDELPTETRAGINAEYTKYDDVSGLTVEKLPEDKGWFKQGKRHQRDEMIKKAREYVKKNAEHAREVALMGKPALNDTGIDLETLILAVMEFDKVDSKSDLGFRYMHNIAMTRSEAGTTLGLHAQDGSYQTYLDGYRRLTAAMTESAAYKYAGRGADSITKFNNDVEALCAKYADAVDNGSMSREQALKALVAEASVKFAGEEDTTILNQLDLTQSGKTREAFVEYAKRLVRRDIAKAEPDTKMQGKLLALAPQAEKASQDLNSKNPATASAAAKKMREWSELVHSADPRQTVLSGAINSYAPRAMLSGISTHVTNIFSNTAEQAMLRPAIAAHYGKNIVPQADIDAEKARIKAVYDATFMNLTSMITPTDPTLVHGEKYKPLDPDAKGWQKIYDAPMRALAAEDNWFRIPTYLDIAARMASRDANGDVNKAKELFKQYTSTQPKKINGKENPLYAKRAEIVTMSAFATFTQNGKLAGALNKMRDGLNSLSVGGYELQLGTLIAPFIKTPANIIASGLRSPFGAGVTLYKKIVGKEISFQDAADTAHFIGLAMLALIAGAFCDYEEPYKGGKYNPNKPYDSIGIGGYWLKLNSLGVLEAPMRVFMSALHGGQVEILETVGSVPLIGELVDNRLNYATKNPTGWAAGTVYNQANKLIPTLVKQIAKPVIKSTGAETDIESIDLGFKTGIGGKIERTWGLDGIDPTINHWLGIVFNRIKITD